MNDLQFNNGVRSFTINGDENCVVCINTSDWSLLERLKDMKERIRDRVRKLEEVSDDDALEAITRTDREVREELDAVFGKGVSAAAFGSLNCLTFAGGQPIVLNFLEEALMPEIQRSLADEQERANEKISRYTNAVRQFE